MQVVTKNKMLHVCRCHLWSYPHPFITLLDKMMNQKMLSVVTHVCLLTPTCHIHYILLRQTTLNPHITRVGIDNGLGTNWVKQVDPFKIRPIKGQVINETGQ